MRAGDGDGHGVETVLSSGVHFGGGGGGGGSWLFGVSGNCGGDAF